MSHHRAAPRPRPALAWALALASLASCRADQVVERSLEEPTGLASILDWSEFPIGPNDVVRVSVYGHPELSTTLVGNVQGTRVDGEGFLSLPLVGALRVGGMELSEARRAITAAYSRYVREPHVDMSIAEYGARRFYVFGQVKQPGAYVFDRPLNFYQGLSLSGGFDQGADRERVYLLRNASGSIDVHEIDSANLEASGLVALRPDDLVYVPRTGAARFREEILPYLSGFSSTVGTVAALFLIDNNND